MIRLSIYVKFIVFNVYSNFINVNRTEFIIIIQFNVFHQYLIYIFMRFSFNCYFLIGF